jgi:hypothetical protein
MPRGITPFIEVCGAFKAKREISGCWRSSLIVLRRFGVKKDASIFCQLSRRVNIFCPPAAKKGYELIASNSAHNRRSPGLIQTVDIGAHIKCATDGFIVARYCSEMQAKVVKRVLGMDHRVLGSLVERS